MEIHEYEYLKSLVENVTEIGLINEGIFVMGSSKEDEGTKNLIYINDIDGWIRNINYLIKSINFSADTVLTLLKSKEIKSFSFWGDENREEYYYTENIMFRLVTMWDLLAQITNTALELQNRVDSIHYKAFFEKLSNENNLGKSFFELAKEIKEYIKDKEDDTSENPWKGNHNFVDNLRNSFTHRLNPHLVNFHNGLFKNDISKQNISIPVPPIYELKRLLEDYVQVYKFICKVLKHFIKDITFE